MAWPEPRDDVIYGIACESPEDCDIDSMYDDSIPVYTISSGSSMLLMTETGKPTVEINPGHVVTKSGENVYTGSVEWRGTLRHTDHASISGLTEDGVDVSAGLDTEMWDSPPLQKIADADDSAFWSTKDQKGKKRACPYCAATNYAEVGHCHHCAAPFRGD